MPIQMEYKCITSRLIQIPETLHISVHTECYSRPNYLFLRLDNDEGMYMYQTSMHLYTTKKSLLLYVTGFEKRGALHAVAEFFSITHNFKVVVQ